MLFPQHCFECMNLQRTHTHMLSLAHTHTLSLAHTHTLSLAHTHTHTQLSLASALTCVLTAPQSCAHRPTLLRPVGVPWQLSLCPSIPAFPFETGYICPPPHSPPIFSSFLTVRDVIRRLPLWVVIHPQVLSSHLCNQRGLPS